MQLLPTDYLTVNKLNFADYTQQVDYISPSVWLSRADEGSFINLQTGSDILTLTGVLWSFPLAGDNPLDFNINNTANITFRPLSEYSISDIIGINGVAYLELDDNYFEFKLNSYTADDVIPAGGGFNYTRSIVVNPNDPNKVIFKTIASGLIHVANSCTIQAVSSINGLISQPMLFNFIIDSALYELGEEYALHAKSNKDILCVSTALKSTTSIVDNEYAIESNAMAYSQLNNVFKDNNYETYKQYIKDNAVYALYADELLTLPFPFVFTLSIGNNDYFSVPDDYTAVYLNGDNKYKYTIDSMVCKFNETIPTGAVITVVSDYCLRLCIDTLATDRTSIVSKVWTDIPINNYLSTSSNNVLLSVDGQNFSKVIKLTNNFLYIKGMLDNTKLYGYNIFDVIIKLVTSEVIDEYSH